MENTQLDHSSHRKLQIVDEGFTLCLNIARSNRHYFRCIHKKPTQCKVYAVVKGELEDGKFGLLSHQADKHPHEKFEINFFLKEFHSQFKSTCIEKIDVPVQQVYEDLKVAFATSLSPTDRATFLTNLPPPSFDDRLPCQRGRLCPFAKKLSLKWTFPIDFIQHLMSMFFTEEKLMMIVIYSCRTQCAKYSVKAKNYLWTGPIDLSTKS